MSAWTYRRPADIRPSITATALLFPAGEGESAQGGGTATLRKWVYRRPHDFRQTVLHPMFVVGAAQADSPPLVQFQPSPVYRRVCDVTAQTRQRVSTAWWLFPVAPVADSLPPGLPYRHASYRRRCDVTAQTQQGFGALWVPPEETNSAAATLRKWVYRRPHDYRQPVSSLAALFTAGGIGEQPSIVVDGSVRVGRLAASTQVRRAHAFRPLPASLAALLAGSGAGEVPAIAYEGVARVSRLTAATHGRRAQDLRQPVSPLALLAPEGSAAEIPAIVYDGTLRVSRLTAATHGRRAQDLRQVVSPLALLVPESPAAETPWIVYEGSARIARLVAATHHRRLHELRRDPASLVPMMDVDTEPPIFSGGNARIGHNHDPVDAGRVGAGVLRNRKGRIGS